VIAFQKNLVAAADAHHLVADLVKARGGVAGAEERDDGEAEQDGLREFASQRPAFRLAQGRLSRKGGEKWVTRFREWIQTGH
jgi:hypothetical protein